MKKQTLGHGAHKHQYFYAVDDYLKDLAFILKVTLLYTWQQLQMIENVLLHFISNITKLSNEECFAAD